MNNDQQQGWAFHHQGTQAQIRENFDLQRFLTHIGAVLGPVLPGAVEILLPYSGQVDQHHGFFHGGAIATIADSASGAAAQTLLEPGATVLTTEFKINFVAPAIGTQLIARGRVIKPGRTLTVCQSDVFVQKDDMEKDEGEKDERETLVATALLTMICVPASKNRGKSDVAK